MIWFSVILLGAAAFLFSAFVLKLPRATWTLFAATLLFGLAGYGWQASPDVPAAPTQPRQENADNGQQMVAARLEFGRPDRLLPRELITADAFTRRGRFADAAGLLRGAVEERPQSSELWLALGMNLVAHAEGRVTPPALYAFRQAEDAAPGQIAAGFFRGAAILGQGDVAGGREEWARALSAGDEDAWGREDLQARLAQLDAIIANGAARTQRALPPATPPPSTASPSIP